MVFTESKSGKPRGEYGPREIWYKARSKADGVALVREFWEAVADNASNESFRQGNGYADEITYGSRTEVIEEGDGTASILFSGNGGPIMPEHWEWLKGRGIQ